MGWSSVSTINAQDFECGYCDRNVASDRGYFNQAVQGHVIGFIYICPKCANPTYFSGKKQVPNPLPGNPLPEAAPKDVVSIYEEARKAYMGGAHTGAVLLCRKILIHIAHDLGSPGKQTFNEAITWMNDNQHIPKNGLHVVKHIKDKGNEATHELVLSTAAEAGTLLMLVHRLVLFNYEFETLVEKPT